MSVLLLYCDARDAFSRGHFAYQYDRHVASRKSFKNCPQPLACHFTH